MGFIIRSAVDDRTVGCRHLNHGAVKVLPEGVGCKRCRISGLRSIHKSLVVRLAWKIDTGLGAEAKLLLVFVEFLLSHLLGDLHHNDITRLHQTLLHR